MESDKPNPHGQHSDSDEPNPDEQPSCGQLPGMDIDIEYAGSKPIDKENPELVVHDWVSLREILRMFRGEILYKLFPPRHDEDEEDEDNA